MAILGKKMKILKFSSREAAASLMSVAAPLWFWKFWEKNSKFWNFSENFENYVEFWKIMNYNFQSRRQIMTAREYMEQYLSDLNQLHIFDNIAHPYWEAQLPQKCPQKSSKGP